jgi:ankyrin repeat protein
MTELRLVSDEAEPPLDVHIESLTALNWASHRGKVDLVRQLLPTEATIENSRYSSLDLAAKQGHDDVMRILLDHGHEIEGWPFQHPLISAIRHHQSSIVRLLLESGAAANGVDPDWTPLHEAAENGHMDSMVMLEREADWKAVTNDRNDYDDFLQTALHLAALNGDDGKVKLLLRRMDRSFVDKTNSSGRTALHLLAKGPSRADHDSVNEEPRRE